jgi:hypothetical protein
MTPPTFWDRKQSRRLDRKDGTAGLKSDQRPLDWAAADLGAARKGGSAPPLSSVLHFRPHLPPYNAMAETCLTLGPSTGVDAIICPNISLRVLPWCFRGSTRSNRLVNPTKSLKSWRARRDSNTRPLPSEGRAMQLVFATTSGRRFSHGRRRDMQNKDIRLPVPEP